MSASEYTQSIVGQGIYLDHVRSIVGHLPLPFTGIYVISYAPARIPYYLQYISDRHLPQRVSVASLSIRLEPSNHREVLSRALWAS